MQIQLEPVGYVRGSCLCLAALRPDRRHRRGRRLAIEVIDDHGCAPLSEQDRAGAADA